MKKLIATSAAGLTVMISTMAPALASTCEAASQTVTRTAGTWSSLSGPIVSVTVDPSGVTWAVGPDAELDSVMLEYAPTTSDGATVSSAVLLPGSETGSMSIEGEADVVVRFEGTACVPDRPDDAIVEVSAEKAQPVVAEDEPAVAVSAQSVTTQTVAERVLEIRRFCWLARFPA